MRARKMMKKNCEGMEQLGLKKEYRVNGIPQVHLLSGFPKQ